MLGSCRRSAAREVVAYVALDSEFARPVLDRFTRRTGIRVAAVFDWESTKTVGLANRLIAEKPRPRCDLFWNNEILQTLRLKREGILRPFAPDGVRAIPERFRDRDGMWYGFAARARVLIVHRKALGNQPAPASVHDLVDPRWKGKGAIARPLFGTTSTHAAVWLARWGRQRTEAFLRKLQTHAVVLPGNRQVAEHVARGEAVFGLTDTDDVMVQRGKGFPVELVFPDQGAGEGTLLIPNTVACIAGRPDRAEVQALARFLLSEEVERMLAEGPSAQIPLRSSLRAGLTRLPNDLKIMDVDFERAAQNWKEAMELVQRYLT